MISTTDYQKLTELVYSNFGISLGAEKRTMVIHRIQSWILEQGFSDFKTYFSHLKNDRNGSALKHLANRLTTNYSYFYREQEQLEFFFQKSLPEKNLSKSEFSSTHLNIWSAGCSSGEEPYSISMLISEYFNSPFPPWKLGILATDLDTNILQEAYRGIYREDRLKQLPSHLKMKYMSKKPDGFWAVNQEVKNRVHFSRFNLIKPQFEFNNRFFAIFCRNVMIYFDHKAIKELVRRFYDVTENLGYLFIGQTESLDKEETLYKYIAPSIYQKVE